MFLFRRRSPWRAVSAACSGLGCLVALGLGLMAYFTAHNALDAMKNVAAELRASQQDLIVRSHKMVKEKDKRFIVGSCVNRSKTQTYLPTEVTFSLYDGNGIVIGLAMAQTTDLLRPGATWKFKAPVENPAAATCQVQGAAGFPAGIMLEKAVTNLDPANQSRIEFLLKNLDEFSRRAIQDPKLRKLLQDGAGAASPEP